MFLLATMLKDGLNARNCSSYAAFSSHHPSLLTSGPFRTYSQAYPDCRLVRASIPPPPSQCQATVGPQRPSSGAQLPPGGCPVRHVGVDGARATIAEQGRWAPLLCRRQGPKSPTLFARKLYVAETPLLHVFDFFCYSSRLYCTCCVALILRVCCCTCIRCNCAGTPTYVWSSRTWCTCTGAFVFGTLALPISHPGSEEFQLAPDEGLTQSCSHTALPGLRSQAYVAV